MEFEHKLLHQFSVAVACHIPAFYLFACMKSLQDHMKIFLFSSLPEFVCEVTVIVLIEW